jgi:hypothetical protein
MLDRNFRDVVPEDMVAFGWRSEEPSLGVQVELEVIFEGSG